MKVLQLTSDWKWTGPAEPMLRLTRGLEDRGHTVELACPLAPEPRRDGLAERARAAGVDPVLTLERHRGVHPWRDRHDAKRLRQLLRQGGYDVVHTWHTRDHVLALRARRGLATRVVRSWRSASPARARPWNRWLFGPGSDGVWCVSPASAVRIAALRGGRPVAGGFGAVDLDRFRPQPAPPDVRASLGLDPADVVVGIVARVQRHRRFDLLLEAARRLCDREASARVLVVGRGTRRDGLKDRLSQKLHPPRATVPSTFGQVNPASMLTRWMRPPKRRLRKAPNEFITNPSFCQGNRSSESVGWGTLIVAKWGERARMVV